MKIFRRYIIYIHMNLYILYIHMYSIDAFLQQKNLAEKTSLCPANRDIKR